MLWFDSPHDTEGEHRGKWGDMQRRTGSRISIVRNQLIGPLAVAVYLGLMLFAPHAHAVLDIAPLWSADIDMVMEGAPIAVDVDGDGHDDIVTAAYEALIALDGSGEEL